MPTHTAAISATIIPYSTIVAPSSPQTKARAACTTLFMVRSPRNELNKFIGPGWRADQPARRWLIGPPPSRLRLQCSAYRSERGSDLGAKRRYNPHTYGGDKCDHHPVLDHRCAILIRQKRTETAGEL